MYTQLLMLAQLVSPAIVTSTMSESERYEKLAPYFHPAPGAPVEIDATQVTNLGKGDPLALEGFIQVSPPKGSCFIVTRADDLEDDMVCTAKKLRFDLSMLDTAGRVKWKVKTGKGDPGAQYIWPTPHRFAQAIAAGEKSEPKIIPIRYCISQNDDKGRRVVLQLMNGKEWIIYLPATDMLMKQPPPPPLVRMGGKLTDEERKTTQMGEIEKHTYSLEEKKKDKPVTAFWTMPERYSYEMPVDNFRSSPTTPGLNGVCRYQYSRAPMEPTKGWMECHHAADYEVLLMNLPCLKR